MEKTKVLIVDDHIENIIALSHSIASDDINILSAQSADEALALLLEHDFALALLDVHMPKTSGFELARLIRGVNKYKNLPVIFVTAHQQDQSVIFEGYETGAVDLLFKPLDPHVVRSKVRVFIKLDQQSKLLQQHMKTLETLTKEAETANIAKSQFLANMSHEIRTPLAAILGFADILSQDDLDSAQKKEFSTSIERNGKLLLRIIDDILDISKIEAQKIQLDEIPINFEELIEDVKMSLLAKMQNKNINLQFEVADLPRNYFSDPIRIKQILLNIIGNAVKFTPKGDVKVKVYSEASRSQLGAQEIIFEVADNGIGISSEQVQKLFKPFHQADSSTRRQFGGTGLGLTISKQLAQSLGGDVELVHSEQGKGSLFKITLLLKEKNSIAETTDYNHTSATDVADISKIQKKVLVVDDSADNRLLVEVFLRKLNVSLEFAHNGKDAVESVKNKAFDLILMDIQMPEMDGCEATAFIRSLGVKTPVIALTAHAMKAEHEKYLSHGCNHVITKPIDRQHLVQITSQYLNTSL